MLYHKSNYSITDSLKETAIVGIDAAALDDNLMQNSKREDQRVEANTGDNLIWELHFFFSFFPTGNS